MDYNKTCSWFEDNLRIGTEKYKHRHLLEGDEFFEKITSYYYDNNVLLL